MTSFDAGGTEQQMVELVRRLPRDTWEVHLACLHARGRWLERAADAAASIEEFAFRGFRRPEAYRQALAFARWCVRHRIEVVHTADLYANIFGLPPAACAGVPVRVGNRRGLNSGHPRGLLALQRAAYTCAHAVVANSAATAAQLRAEHVPARKVALIPNGLDVERFSAAPHRSPRRRVIVVANLRPEKGHDVLVDAAAEVLRRHPDVRFDLVGDGPERPAIERRLHERGVVEAFRLLGERADVPALLNEAAVFVLPSRTESLPNALLEAMAAGLPVVASRVGGIPEVIVDGETGLLTPPGHAGALAHALCRVLDAPAQAGALGEAARTAVLTRFSFDRMVAETENLYRRELSRRGRRALEMAA